MKALWVGLIVLLVGIAAWSLWSRDEVAPSREAQPVAPAPSPAAPVQADVAKASVTLGTPVESAAAPERVAAPSADVEQPQCILRGRCVDAAGQPIGEVLADLIGWTGNDERMAEWRKQHAEPERVAMKVTTGSDGVFEFRFWPPPPFVFALRLHGSGVAAWSERWGELPAGATKDLGDVKLARGTLLRGRVVHADGTPLAKAELRIDAKDRDGARGGNETWCTAHTKDDGTFVARWPLAAGDYQLGIDNQKIERPSLVTLAGDRAEQELEVVLQRISGENVIAGIVVDQTGTPVWGATIFPALSGQGRIINSDKEGRFRVLRPDGAPDRVGLQVHHEGYETEPNQEQYAWGRTDVRLVLRKGQGLEVLVVRAADESPVEDYVLRVMPLGGGFFSSSDANPRGGDHHPGGRTAVETIRPGTHQVFVEPKGDDLALGVERVEITATGAARAVVRLVATTPRLVRVRHADDSPVIGTNVQLVDPLGEPLTDKVPVSTLARWSSTSARKALAFAEATTDERGEVTLRAPGDRPLGLFLPGPKHAAKLVPSVVFPESGPFVVTVDRGASLRVTIGPETALAEIRRLAGIEEGSNARRAIWPSLFLTRDDPRDPVRFPDARTRNTMQPDGTFLLDGVPSGRWHVTVQCFRKRDRGGNTWEAPGGLVELAEGQDATLAVDLSCLLPGELEGLVLHNGEPLGAAKLNLQCSFGKDVTGDDRWFYEPIETDAEGRFRIAVPRGDHRLLWNRERGDRWVSLRARELAQVRVGQPNQQTFTFESGTVKVRLLDAAGAGVGKVAIAVRDANGPAPLSLPPTDDAGRSEGEGEVGVYTAWVLPKALQEPKALQQFYQARAGQPDPTASVRQKVGTFTTRRGEKVEVDLHLPPGWGQ